MKLYLKYMSILFKSEMEYRTSFILLSVGQFFVPFLVFVSIFLLFQRFPTIGGWSIYEVALCYGVIHMGFSLSECFARGFDTFSSMIVNGDFDRILVRPRSTILQVLGSKFEFTRIGRLLQSIIVLIFSITNLDVAWDIYKIITLVLMSISGVVIFSGIFMLGATLCFWTTEGLEVINIFTDGGREISQYPLSIYKDWVKKFFTFVIPFGTVNYLPLMFILDKVEGNSVLYMITPLLGMLFIIPCILIWNFGVKHYKSTGS
ncbi:ABC transporter permease [Caldisalinibacter kiritimatiensis]|uniref:ABC transporter permease protein n=1 Tax=Caldisalinibacter kiritimatiensis TaxID=1304284 RepID=R1CE18_9FIRM|nr:ABC-2 family transporter protein [Caldisalinibacter kiritimatiensis]EOD00510.1 ABC transporter permease protein [Caldisalinibacter kiritimatiensis]